MQKARHKQGFAVLRQEQYRLGKGPSSLHGGVLENEVVEDGVPVQRYWIRV